MATSNNTGTIVGAVALTAALAYFLFAPKEDIRIRALRFVQNENIYGWNRYIPSDVRQELVQDKLVRWTRTQPVLTRAGAAILQTSTAT